MSPGDRRLGRGRTGGWRRSGNEPRRQKTWQADRGLGAQWTWAQATENLGGGWQGAGGHIGHEPRKPRTWQGAGRGRTGGWGHSGRKPRRQKDRGRGRTGGAVDMSQEGGRRPGAGGWGRHGHEPRSQKTWSFCRPWGLRGVVLEPRRAGLASQETQPLAQSKPNQDSSSTNHCKPRVGAHWREPLKV